MGAVVVDTPFGLRVEPLPPYVPGWGAAAGSAARATASGSGMPGGGAAARLLAAFKGLALAARAEPAAAGSRAGSDPGQPPQLALLPPPQPLGAAAAASDSSSAAGGTAAGCQAARSGGSEPSEQAGGSGVSTAGGGPHRGATLGGSGFGGSGWAADPEAAAGGDGEQALTLGQVLALFEDSELFRGGPVEGLQLLHRRLAAFGSAVFYAALCAALRCVRLPRLRPAGVGRRARPKIRCCCLPPELLLAPSVLQPGVWRRGSPPCTAGTACPAAAAAAQR